MEIIIQKFVCNMVSNDYMKPFPRFVKKSQIKEIIIRGVVNTPLGERSLILKFDLLYH